MGRPHLWVCEISGGRAERGKTMRRWRVWFQTRQEDSKSAALNKKWGGEQVNDRGGRQDQSSGESVGEKWGSLLQKSIESHRQFGLG